MRILTLSWDVLQYWNGQIFAAVPIYSRACLLSGHLIQGPAIITEMDSNTLVHPDYRAEIDRQGNILLWPIAERDESDEIKAAGLHLEKDSQVVNTQIIEAALANARAEMDGLIVRVAMSPAMREQLDYVRGLIVRPDSFVYYLKVLLPLVPHDISCKWEDGCR